MPQCSSECDIVVHPLQASGSEPGIDDGEPGVEGVGPSGWGGGGRRWVRSWLIFAAGGIGTRGGPGGTGVAQWISRSGCCRGDGGGWPSPGGESVPWWGDQTRSLSGLPVLALPATLNRRGGQGVKSRSLGGWPAGRPVRYVCYC
eukprot:761475-Hanusia_phi.AAC.5